MADVAVINKIDSANPEAVAAVEKNIKKVNPSAKIIKAESSITVDKPENHKRKESSGGGDGPTLTHGEMKIGAGTVAAKCLAPQGL